MMLKSVLKNKIQGFTLIEILIYLFITAMLLVTLSGLVYNNFNARKQLIASNLINHDARFVLNYLSNRIHNVVVIDDIRPDTYQIFFYPSETDRFSLSVEADDLVYREVEDVGSGFPEQNTATPMVLNSSRAVVSNFILTPVDDSQSNSNQGVIIEFDITTKGAYGPITQSFETFITIR